MLAFAAEAFYPAYNMVDGSDKDRNVPSSNLAFFSTHRCAMSEPLPYTHPLRRAALPQRKPTRFDLQPDAAERAALAQALGLLDLPEVRLKGELTPSGRADYALTAQLEAQVVQPCIITAEPVATRLSEAVTRRYVSDWQAPEAEEIEMPEDDSVEPLGEVIDLGHVLTEALSLALPLYPRAEGAEFGSQQVAEPGAEPLTEEKMRPFAGLADLLKKKPE